jgi:hypothetical protein
MTSSILNTPMLWINAYLQDSLKGLGFSSFPFFPLTPSSVNDLETNFPEGGVMALYDRMIKPRKNAFPHVKCEELVYYFYSTSENATLNVIKIVEQVLRTMDREDETAYDLNMWAKSKGTIMVGKESITPNFNFHNFKVYQIQETKDVMNYNTTRPISGTKIVIYFEYNSVN